MTSTATASPSASAKRHHPFWPTRLPYAIEVPQTSLWFNLEVSARRYPTKTAVVYLNRRITYAELLQASERMAAALQGLGLAAGDRVVVCMQNCPQFIVACHAIWRANAVVVPVNPMNRADELGHYITDPDTRLAVVSADLAGQWALAQSRLPAGQGLQHLVVTQHGDGFDTSDAGLAIPDSWKDWLFAEVASPVIPGVAVHAWHELLARADVTRLGPHTAGADDLALLPYTSGTTGLPKGCMHPHRSLMHNAMAGGAWVAATNQVVSLCAVPMFHITGMVALMLASVHGGGTLVVMPRWDREVARRLIADERVTHWTNIPTMVIDLFASPNLVGEDLVQLEVLSGGGAAMPQAVAQRLYELCGIRFMEGYGLTETAAPSHSNPPDRPKQQCLGIPYLGVDSRIIDPDTLQELPAGQSGEIIIHGPQVFDGYWKNPRATEAAFLMLDGKRFFRSGDLGHCDEEGYFFLTDRLKRMINASGFKVWPAEVEALMFKHPAIQEACVIPAHDAYRGETVKAVVVLRAGHHGTVTEDDIIAWCREHMAAYKVPRSVEFADALPKSGSGKVMWRLLQERQNRPA